MTKLQKARIIVSAKYGMNYACTENDHLQWREAKSMAQNNSIEQIAETYEQALIVLQQKAEKEGRDIIGDFVEQVN